MYLVSPLEISLSNVVAFSALTVIALMAVMRMFPRRAVVACRIAVVQLWMFGTYVAVYGGFRPGRY